MHGPGPASAEITDTEDGSYKVVISSFVVAGNYSATVSLVHSGGGVELLSQGSLLFEVACGILTSSCSVFWPSVAPAVVVGEQLSLTLWAHDAHGNRLVGLGGAVAVLERVRGPHEFHEPALFVPCDLTRGAPVSTPKKQQQQQQQRQQQQQQPPPLHEATSGRVAVASAPADGDGGGDGGLERTQFHLSAHPTRAGSYMPTLTIDGRTFHPPHELLIHVRTAHPSAARSYDGGTL